MLVKLVCPACRKEIVPDGPNWKCPACARPFTHNQGVLSFLTPEERFNEGVYEEKQIAAWSYSARLRNKIRASKWLTWMNRVRVWCSLSGRRDRIFWREMGSRGRRDFIILDIGCGGGRHYFCDFGKVIGVDPVLPLLQMAQQIYDEVYQSSGFNLPFADESFDYVVSSDVLGHIAPEHKDQLFGEIHRVLKKGGRTIHCIEAESTSPWYRFAHKYPDLFQIYFVDRPGHIGMELPSEWRARFLNHGFREIAFKKLSSRVQEPGTITALFDNEYKTRSRLIRAIVAVDRVLSRSFAVKEALNFVLEPLAALDDWLTPFDYGCGALVVYEKK
jgi:ubiquinone/menaquinone biosynthesis C-methylase UbiE